MVKLELPYPPTINHYYGNRPRGGKFIKPSGKAFRQEVAVLVTQAKAMVNYDGPIRVEIIAEMPDKRRRDIDNINKALLDALQHAQVYKDDTQIQQLYSEKAGFTKGGKVTVTIKPI